MNENGLVKSAKVSGVFPQTLPENMTFCGAFTKNAAKGHFFGGVCGESAAKRQGF